VVFFLQIIGGSVSLLRLRPVDRSGRTLMRIIVSEQKIKASEKKERKRRGDLSERKRKGKRVKQF